MRRAPIDRGREPENLPEPGKEAFSDKVSPPVLAKKGVREMI